MRVLVGMSGGVDSSTAALLLSRQGHEVAGAFLSFNPGSSRDAEDARRTAEFLGLPFHVLDAACEFNERVVEPFVSEYARGRTPNPCVVCNSSVKFPLLLGLARELGSDAVATGHYARKGESGALLRARDEHRDQSYFLCRLSPGQLERVLFPLGDLAKDEVKSLARDAGLPARERPDSQDACFLPRGGLEEFLRSRIPEAFRKGEIVDVSGRVLGTHGGFARYTVGQRSGLAVALGERAYVVRVLAGENRIVVGPEERLHAGCVAVEDVSLLAEVPREFDALVKIRHRHQPAKARVRLRENDARVVFRAPQRAPTPGQTAAFYSGERTLGAGTISGVQSGA